MTRLVHHIFSDDMDKVRSFVREVLEPHNKEMMTAGVLWGVFKTHGVMQDYLHHSIEHHPSITSEYTKFLITDRANSEDDSALVVRLDEMERRVVVTEQVAREAKTSAASAINQLKQLKSNLGMGAGGGGGVEAGGAAKK